MLRYCYSHVFFLINLNKVVFYTFVTLLSVSYLMNYLMSHFPFCSWPKIEWMLSGINEPSKDFSKTSGLILMKEGQSVAYIDLILLQDNEDEFDETFALTMTRSSAGADIDRNYSTVSFTIRLRYSKCYFIISLPYH